jgi:hypothetical protein
MVGKQLALVLFVVGNAVSVHQRDEVGGVKRERAERQN